MFFSPWISSSQDSFCKLQNLYQNPALGFVTAAVLYSFLQDSSSLLTHPQPNFFFLSPTHLSPRGHCQQEEGLGRSARQSVLLACMQAVELTSTTHSKLSQPAYQPGRPPPPPPPLPKKKKKKERLPLHCSALLNWPDFGWPAPTEALRDVVMSHQKEEVRKKKKKKKKRNEKRKS